MTWKTGADGRDKTRSQIEAEHQKTETGRIE
jgi:hypothetical protein